MKKPKNVIIPEGMKWCSGMVYGNDIHGDKVEDHIHPLEEFHVKNSTVSGRQSNCKLVKKEIDRIEFQNNKEEYAKKNKKKRHERTLLSVEIKSDLKCVACGFGSPDHHMCLVFHHTNPKEKEFCIADAIRNMVAIEKIEDEIKKSVVLCSNCHAVITYYYTQYYYEKITADEVYKNLKKHKLESYLII